MVRLRDETPAFQVRLIKQVLRHENVKECLEHYPRRNAGTRRVFELAHFRRSADA